MVRITLMDGQTQEITREEVQGIYPWRPLFRNPHLKSDGLTYHAGELLPVHGPVPEAGAENLDASERPWLLFFASHAQVVRGLPSFDDDIALNIVPPREIPAPLLALVPPPPALVEAAPAETPLTLLDMTAMLSEEDEETKLLRELEELVKSA